MTPLSLEAVAQAPEWPAHVDCKVECWFSPTLRTLAAENATLRADARVVTVAQLELWQKEWAQTLTLARNGGGHGLAFDDDRKILAEIHAIIGTATPAPSDKPAPAATVDIDALAYRFWSIHPKDIPDPVGMPDGYKGGARAWMYATEIREAIRAIAGGGDE